MEDSRLDQIVEAVLSSPKGRGISEDFVREIGKRELARRSNLKEAIKATKSKLHQVAGSNFDASASRRYGRWLEYLKAAHESGDRELFLKACMEVAAHHASTRERVPILEQFYATILAGLPAIHSVLDIACGLNPLFIPWMPLAQDVEYFGYDIYDDMTAFLNEFMALIGVRGRAETRDVIRSCPTQNVQLAFVLKAIPCLEQVDGSAGLRILETLNADHVVVSFPVRSLTGKAKGMAVNYEARFRQMVAGKTWGIKKFEFASELAFLVSK